jgi:hypothetical protein
LAYRLAAIRETFEESGILLARAVKAGHSGPLLSLSDEVRERGRKEVHGNRVRFRDWLRSVGGEADVGAFSLIASCPRTSLPAYIALLRAQPDGQH